MQFQLSIQVWFYYQCLGAGVVNFKNYKFYQLSAFIHLPMFIIIGNNSNYPGLFVHKLRVAIGKMVTITILEICLFINVDYLTN